MIDIHTMLQVHFNVFSPSKTGNEWGMFTTDTDIPVQIGGPSYHEMLSDTRVCASKVSVVGRSWDTVLLSRLRFKPDVLEPTSL
jgi:abelson tyrosine-protein kinase 1